MIQFNKKCTTCKRIKMEKAEGRETLLNRLYHSRAYDRAGESISKIAREITHQRPYNGVEKTTYQSLQKHVKFHQAINEDDLVEAKIARSVKRRDNVIIKELVQHRDVRQEIMSKGLEQIQSGEVKLTAASVVTAANKEADIELREKDQKLKLMEMIAMYQSGEIQRTNQDLLDE